jgi:cytochrome c oxidase subunit 1
MTTPETNAAAAAPPDYLSAKRGLASWLATTDHKRIGLMYMALVLVFFLFAASLAVTFRTHLMFQNAHWLSNDGYNRLLTLHGIVMIFLFIIPAIPAIFGNFFLPILVGAEDVAFPRINLFSWYCYAAGGALALGSVVLGGVDTGWTFYVPYSLQTEKNVLLPMLAAFILGWSSILTGLNFITTIHRLRSPRMRWFQMPLFAWALYATAWVQVLVTPVIGITLVLVLIERILHVPLFSDVLLYQHLFWIYSHPAVYIMILPAMGIVSEIIPTFSRKAIFGYRFIAFSSLAIAAIGSLVWAHHMFTSGMADTARIVFSLLTYLVAVPSAIKVFNWLATMYRGSIDLAPPMVWALMFIVLFSVGGLTGLIISSLVLNIHLHDTAFIVAHFHYTMFGGAGVIFFAALHYWWPKMTGRMYNTKVAHVAAGLFFVGFNLTYLPLFMAGALGMPRRYATYPAKYTVWHHLSTLGSWILFAALVLALANLLVAWRRGRRAGPDPWGGATLEWRTPSPPPVANFVGEPDLGRGAYEYPVEVKHD